ncbi:GntR family transcriptional regulator [Phyllobacterium sp. 21LDTY02-6]|uniref:GntR family transcriptional regulator n=1 Tax=Phyllobacterium sp. 21LDTY02-6 TaxID=2944903 RepID=UPI00202204DD|nr:GntR family transcriptional regulator [Phyllobacterium sp. 21LDTY02-6]MCO4318141.1 GntR family transcriptional regulator [Phyllobacterium sp. 21LDTY02-6]
MTANFKLAALTPDTTRARQTSVGGQVYEVVRNAIVQLQLRPGDAVSESEIAAQLGVSRQPVREAFIKLSEAGLVEIRPQRGTFVRLISVQEVENAQFLREAIEVAVVRKAALQASAAGIAQLRDIIEQQRRAAARGDHSGFLRLDEAYHQAIAGSVNCDDAWRVLDSLKAQMDRVRYLSLPEATPLDAIIDQHATIVEALETGSPETAESAMHIHLREILKSLPKLAAENRSFFAD